MRLVNLLAGLVNQIATFVISSLLCLHYATIKKSSVSKGMCVLFLTLFSISLIVLIGFEMSVHMTAGFINKVGSDSVLGALVFFLTSAVIL